MTTETPMAIGQAMNQELKDKGISAIVKTDHGESRIGAEIDQPDENGVTEADRAVMADYPPGGWLVGDDLELAPEGALLATQRLSRQLALLPETCLLTIKKATISVEGGEFREGEVLDLHIRGVVSGSKTEAKVLNDSGELDAAGKEQYLTVLPGMVQRVDA